MRVLCAVANRVRDHVLLKSTPSIRDGDQKLLESLKMTTSVQDGVQKLLVSMSIDREREQKLLESGSADHDRI